MICIEQKGPTISSSFKQTKDECGGLFGSGSRGQMMSDTKFLLPIRDQLSGDQPLVTNLARKQNIQSKQNIQRKHPLFEKSWFQSTSRPPSGRPKRRREVGGWRKRWSKNGAVAAVGSIYFRPRHQRNLIHNDYIRSE